MDLRKSILVSLTIAGLTAMASQIVFLREFLISFYGNEISVGIILAAWLAWGALGSLVLGRFADISSRKVRLFYFSQAILALALPAALFGIRASKSLLGISAGEIVGYAPMAIVTFSILSLPCAILGFMFALGCRVYSEGSPAPAGSIARAYMMESVGAIAGGALVSYVLIPLVDPFGIVFLLSALNAAGALLMQRHDTARAARVSTILTALVAGILAILLASGGLGAVRDLSLKCGWKGFDIVEVKDSIYGNITLTKRSGQISFYENGLHLYTVPDLFTAEQAVHFPLLEHRDPKNILMIGGGAGGLLKEALKYPVENIDYVELDPMMIRMAKKHLLPEDAGVLDDPRVRLINKDGRFFVKRAAEKYDCVIIALGDPYTAQINRFYTVDFFREVKRLMRPGGIVSFALTSSANYIGEELALYLGSIYSSVQRVFPQVMIVPSDTMLLMASDEDAAFTYDAAKLMERRRERGADAQYVREYYLFDALSPERVEYARDVIASGSPELNTDFRPAAYYCATVFWSSQFDSPLMRTFLRSVSSEKIWLIAALACAAVFAAGAARRRARKARAALIALGAGGFAEIIFQITMILSFQVIYGYVFYKIGIIITAFMLGLALGSAAAAKMMPRIKEALRVLIAVQILLCLYPLVLPALFKFFSSTRGAAVDLVGADVVFILLPVIAGFLGGLQFPMANKVYLSGSEGVGRAAGMTYGIDLFGACLGALIVSSFLVPVLGIFGTCMLVALVNVTVLGVLLLAGTTMGRAGK